MKLIYSEIIVLSQNIIGIHLNCLISCIQVYECTPVSNVKSIAETQLFFAFHLLYVLIRSYKSTSWYKIQDDISVKLF